MAVRLYDLSFAQLLFKYFCVVDSIMNADISDSQRLFQAFHAYDWTADPEFQTGLQAVLSQLSPQPQPPPPVTAPPAAAPPPPLSDATSAQPSLSESAVKAAADEQQPAAPVDPHTEETVLRAKLFYFQRKFGGLVIDPAEYRQWVTSQSPDSNDSHHSSLVKDVKAVKAVNDVNATKPAEETPYPSNYANVVQLILSGKDVPGIRDIPDTELGLNSGSAANAQRRRKPWEKDDNVEEKDGGTHPVQI